MLLTTTSMIDGHKITRYYGIVSGETIIGANVFRDLFASIRDIVGGRSGAYEEVLREAKERLHADGDGCRNSCYGGIKQGKLIRQNYIKGRKP